MWIPWERLWWRVLVVGGGRSRDGCVGGGLDQPCCWGPWHVWCGWESRCGGWEIGQGSSVLMLGGGCCLLRRAHLGCCLCRWLGLFHHLIVFHSHSCLERVHLNSLIERGLYGKIVWLGWINLDHNRWCPCCYRQVVVSVVVGVLRICWSIGRL